VKHKWFLFIAIEANQIRVEIGDDRPNSCSLAIPAPLTFQVARFSFMGNIKQALARGFKLVLKLNAIWQCKG